MRLIILAVSFIWSLIFICFFYKKRKSSNKKNKEFVAYLETKGDMDTLYKIGEYNKYGHRERWSNPEGMSALRSKYKETNDIKYKEYADFAVRSTPIFSILFFGSLIGVFVFIDTLIRLLSA